MISKFFDDNKTFWQRIKPLFSDKMKNTANDITLVENDIITSENKEVAEKFNNFFNEAVENLDIELYLTEYMGDQLTCNLQEKLDKYDHPSIKKINENVKLDTKFSFSDITFQEFENEILKLDIKNPVQEDDIPAKVLITTHDIVSNHLSKYYNKAKNNQNYPASFKLANVVPVHKKDERTL